MNQIDLILLAQFVYILILFILIIDTPLGQSPDYTILAFKQWCLKPILALAKLKCGPLENKKAQKIPPQTATVNKCSLEAKYGRKKIPGNHLLKSRVWEITMWKVIWRRNRIAIILERLSGWEMYIYGNWKETPVNCGKKF